MRRTIRGGRSYFFSDPAIDKVLNMVVTLASEVWTLRERLAAMEAQRAQLHVAIADLKEQLPWGEEMLAKHAHSAASDDPRERKTDAQLYRPRERHAVPAA